MKLRKDTLKYLYRVKYGDNWFRVDEGIHMERYRRRLPPQGWRQGVKHLAIDFSLLFDNDANEAADRDVLDELCQEESILWDVLEAVPVCSDFESAAHELIRCIHAIAALESDWDLGQIEIYVGRTGRTAQNLLKRWDVSRTEHRKHDFGLVAFVTDTSNIEAWETGGITIVNALKERKSLCVANISPYGIGYLPSAEQSVVYLTFRVLEDPELCLPADIKVIDEVAREVSEGDRVLGLDAAAIRRILLPVKNLADRAHVSWHADHKF